MNLKYIYLALISAEMGTHRPNSSLKKWHKIKILKTQILGKIDVILGSG